MRSNQHLAFCFGMAAVALFALAGCDSGSRCSVQGKVRYDGEIVGEGGIAFIPVAEEGVRATGEIRNGRFSLDGHRGPVPGKYNVQLYWRKKTGNKVPGEGGHPTDEIVPGIPSKYNTETELTAEIKPGANTLDFDLKK